MRTGTNAEGTVLTRIFLLLLLAICVAAAYSGWRAAHYHLAAVNQARLLALQPIPTFTPAQALQGVTSVAQLQRQLKQISNAGAQVQLQRGSDYLFSAPRRHCVAVRLPPARTVTESQQLVHILRQFDALQQHPQAQLGWCFNGYFSGQPKPLQTQPELGFVDIERAQAKGQQITIAANAKVDLLAHELAHLAGLADEYAMRKPLAEQYCAGRYRHPSLNVVVTSSQVLSSAELKALWQHLPWRDRVSDWRMLGQPARNGWQLGSAEGIGLYPAKTCEETPYYAWKPVAETTAMQHFDIPVWPQLYLELMAEYLQGRRDLRDNDHRASSGEEPH